LVDRDINLKKLTRGNDIVVISGIRRCGKSTLLKLISKEIDRRTVLVNFDDIRFTNFSEIDYPSIEEIISELFGDDVIYLLDEVQNIPAWQRWVNNLHERKKKVFVTGSNSNLLSSEISTYLTGRNRIVTLTPFSFREMMRFKGIEIKDIDTLSTAEKGSIIGSFGRYLELGGFPEVIIREDPDLSRTYFEDILTRDIVVRHGIREIKELKDLSLFLITNSGSPLSYSTLKSISGVKSVSTIKNFIDHLEEAYLVKRVDRFSFSLKKQKAVPSKIYATDIGFLRSVSFNFTDNKGKVLENMVLNHLVRKHREVYYHLERKECDLIIKEGLKVTEAFQVTFSMSDPGTRERELKGLIDAMKTYSLDKGTVITYEEEKVIERDGYRIDIVPAWKWFLKY
jgi:predicted AAA+ superfamily ATPase